MSCVNIIVGLLSVIPLSWHLRIDNIYQICSEKWTDATDRNIYSGYLLIACTAIPIFTVSILYFTLIRNLRIELQKNDCHIDKESPEYTKRVKRNIRIMNLLLVTTLVYALVISPQRVISLYLNLNQGGVPNDLYNVLSFAALLPYPIHLAANPVIYSIIDSKWRNDFKILLKSITHWCGFQNGDIGRFMHHMTTFRSNQSQDTIA